MTMLCFMLIISFIQKIFSEEKKNSTNTKPNISTNNSKFLYSKKFLYFYEQENLWIFGNVLVTGRESQLYLGNSFELMSWVLVSVPGLCKLLMVEMRFGFAYQISLATKSMQIGFNPKFHYIQFLSRMFIFSTVPFLSCSLLYLLLFNFRLNNLQVTQIDSKFPPYLTLLVIYESWTQQMLKNQDLIRWRYHN